MSSILVANAVLKECFDRGLIITARVLITLTKEAAELQEKETGENPIAGEVWTPDPQLGWVTTGLRSKFQTCPHLVMKKYIRDAAGNAYMKQSSKHYARIVLGLPT